MITTTEKIAHDKFCPFFKEYCVASRCMAWAVYQREEWETKVEGEGFCQLMNKG